MQAAQGDFTVSLGDLCAVRLHDQRAAVGVQNSPPPGRHGRSTLAQLHHSGDAHAARHNGGVADRAVLVAGKAQHHAAIQAEQIAGEEPVGHQNAGPL